MALITSVLALLLSLGCSFSSCPYYFIETTMLGNASFEEAVNRASQEFQDALPHLDAKETSYGWVTIWDAR